MENHPIPQDVTGFKFKLIGSITVKQFLYLLGTGIISYLLLILDVHFLLKAPLVLFIVGFGLALAFLPIDGRPFDRMILNFIRAIPRDNQYFYAKNAQEEDLPVKKDKEDTKPIIATASIAAPVVFDKNLDKNQDQPQKQPEIVIEKIKKPQEHAPIEIEIPLPKTPHEPFAPRRELGKKPEEGIVEEKPRRTDRILPFVTKVKEDEHRPPIKTLPLELKKTSPPNIEPPIRAGFPTLPDVGNVILGIVKDPRGRVLQNIIVEVINSSGNPVRAFKTNPLGQFISATPLANGEYKIILEDPASQHQFEEIKISLAGEIFSPLEIESIDEREKLRKELFGNSS